MKGLTLLDGGHSWQSDDVVQIADLACSTESAVGVGVVLIADDVSTGREGRVTRNRRVLSNLGINDLPLRLIVRAQEREGRLLDVVKGLAW